MPIPSQMSNDKSAPYNGPEVRLDEGGQLWIYFDGCPGLVVSPETVGFTRNELEMWLSVNGASDAQIDAAWSRWSALMQADVGKALQWWKGTAFLRDGINVNVRMG